MGFLKKITRPISRVLDKIVPNEIKPALPFLAAAAPFMAPGIMGLGGNTMLSRALISGGLNLGGQLAQEGSEGDFNALSLALASGIGALSAPGAGDTLRGIGKTPGATGADAGFYVGKGMNVPESSTSFLGKAADFAGAGADKLEGIIAAGQAEPFSMAGVKAASIPLTQGAMDLGIAETRRFNKQQIIDDALGALEEGADSAARASAIRLAMQQYGFTEDEITETISSAGYRAGGRVGFKDGTDENLVGIETLKLGEYDMEGFKDKSKTNTLLFGSDDLKALSQSLDYGELSNLSKRQKEKIKEQILLARAGILNPTEFEKEVGLNLNKSQKDFLKTILPDETMEKIFMDDEGDFRKGFQKARALGESAFFGGQKNPTQLSNMYNKLGDKYIEDQKKAIQRRINFNKEYGDANYLNFKDGGLMNLGGKEMDLRKGGFVPIGKKERADDVPARLSKNEFVMTADAVRAAGGGSVNEGAKRMYDVMNKLEARA